MNSSNHSLSVLLTLNPIFTSGEVQEDATIDSNVLPYCSIDKKEKKSLGEMEQEFLQALQVITESLFLELLPELSAVHTSTFLFCL